MDLTQYYAIAAGGVMVFLFITNSSHIAYNSMHFLLSILVKRRNLWKSLVQASLDFIYCFPHLNTIPAQFRSHLSFTYHKLGNWAVNELYHQAVLVLCALLHMFMHVNNVPELNGGTWQMIGLIVRRTSPTQLFANIATGNAPHCFDSIITIPERNLPLLPPSNRDICFLETHSSSVQATAWLSVCL